MEYSIKLADRIRTYLETLSDIKVEGKEMFKGLTFLVDGKMSLNVSGEDLMCRYDPQMEVEVAEMPGLENYCAAIVTLVKMVTSRMQILNIG